VPNVVAKHGKSFQTCQILSSGVPNFVVRCAKFCLQSCRILLPDYQILLGVQNFVVRRAKFCCHTCRILLPHVHNFVVRRAKFCCHTCQILLPHVHNFVVRRAKSTSWFTFKTEKKTGSNADVKRRQGKFTITWKTVCLLGSDMTKYLESSELSRTSNQVFRIAWNYII
jgi:hypothetical protein